MENLLSPDLMKQLIILVGPKGSGKTYIGTLIHEKLGIPFLRVEDIWLSVTSERFTGEYFEEGFRMVEEEIDRQLNKADLLLIESTGASAHFAPFLSAVRQKYSLTLIKINASPDTCRRRIKTRDTSVHIPVSDDRIEQINREASKVDLEFDAVIENEYASDEEILEPIRHSITGKEHYRAFQDCQKESGFSWIVFRIVFYFCAVYFLLMGAGMVLFPRILVKGVAGTEVSPAIIGMLRGSGGAVIPYALIYFLVAKDPRTRRWGLWVIATANVLAIILDTGSVLLDEYTMGYALIDLPVELLSLIAISVISIALKRELSSGKSVIPIANH